MWILNSDSINILRSALQAVVITTNEPCDEKTCLWVRGGGVLKSEFKYLGNIDVCFICKHYAEFNKV